MERIEPWIKLSIEMSLYELYGKYYKNITSAYWYHTARHWDVF